ncbi:Transcription initiation factor TFIID subunit 1 [Cichlidogyrus casuarinus]|uniref:Transcription initiation factor TFIID subunit 1 n=1 Tax=Cichlidogyrus casuarinus TaxID=1844966 RepID=A0ABD2QMS4_9PLAT
MTGHVGRPPKVGGRPSSYMLKKMAREREASLGFDKKYASAQSKMRCGACGQQGHMRTNRECPMYGKSGSTYTPEGKRKPGQKGPKLNTAAVLSEASLDQDLVANAQEFASKPVSQLLAEQEAEERRKRQRVLDIDEIDDLPERTRMASGGSSVGAEDEDRPQIKFRFKKHLLDKLNAASHMVQSANAVVAAYKRRTSNAIRRNSLQASAADEDYPRETVRHKDNRRRIDPRVALNHVFEGIFKEFTQIPGHKVFNQPVKERDYPNYYAIVKKPMDLSKVRSKLHDNVYMTREEFLADIRLIYSNSVEFNGRYTALTESAQKMCALVIENFAEREEKLMRLESMVNPLLDEDDLVGLSYLLSNAIDVMRNVEHSRAFHFPVDGKRYPDYYKRISRPIDLSTLERRVKQTVYRSREEFFMDADLILSNCIEFNGESSPLTNIARKMLKLADDVSVSDTFSDRSRRQSVASSATRMRGRGGVKRGGRYQRDSDLDDDSSSSMSMQKKKPKTHGYPDSFSALCDDSVFSDTPGQGKSGLMPGEYNPSFLDENDEEEERRLPQSMDFDVDSRSFPGLSENVFDDNDDALPAGGELLTEPQPSIPALANDLQLSDSDEDDPKTATAPVS